MVNLFGLKPEDLTDEQLNKVDLSKLVDILPEDNRVLPILINRLSHIDLDSLTDYYSYKNSNFIRVINTKYVTSEFINAYRKFYYRVFEKYKDKPGVRSRVARRELFTPEMINMETHLFPKDMSILHRNEINYSLIKDIDEKYFNRFKDEIKRHITSNYTYEPSYYNAFIKTAPEEDVSEIAEMLKNIKNKHKAKGILVASRNLPKKYFDMALRSLAINDSVWLKENDKLILSIEDLAKLPPVTRLKAMEKLPTSFLAKFKKDEIGLLLFPLMAKYFGRVESLTKNINNKRNMDIV